jgi:hypothetical protein
MRDELLLHGLVVRALVTVESPTLAVVCCGVASAAAAYGSSAKVPRAVALGAIGGTVTSRARSRA